MSTGTPLTEEQIRYIKAHFPNNTNQTIADALGISKSAVSNVQKRFHLKKSEAHNHDMGVKGGKASAAARDNKPLGLTPDVIEKRVASYRKTFREEKARWVFGLPQRTKIRVRQQPRKKCHQRAYLKHLGYILDETNNIAFYTEETTRAVRMEKYPNKKSFYKFMPYAEHE